MARSATQRSNKKAEYMTATGSKAIRSSRLAHGPGSIHGGSNLTRSATESADSGILRVTRLEGLHLVEAHRGQDWHPERLSPEPDHSGACETPLARLPQSRDDALAGLMCEKYKSREPSALATGLSRMLTVSLFRGFG
jgi:hypothetical protein